MLLSWEARSFLVGVSFYPVGRGSRVRHSTYLGGLVPSLLPGDPQPAARYGQRLSCALLKGGSHFALQHSWQTP